MDYGHDASLNQEKYGQSVRDANAFRRGPRENATPAFGVRRHAARIGRLVRKTLSATTRCQWDQARKAISELDELELIPCARTAVSALMAQVIGKDQEAMEHLSILRHTTPPRNADSHVWAAATMAAAFHGYTTGDVDASVQPVALVRQMCAKAGDLVPETVEFLCLSLALLARAGRAPVLASFLLGHLTESFPGTPVWDGATHGTRKPARGLATRYAAAGLCMITLGDVTHGCRLIAYVMDGDGAARQPLLAGLIGAEMVRTELEFGTAASAIPWIERTNRFTRRYECELPATIVTSVRAQLPGS